MPFLICEIATPMTTAAAIPTRICPAGRDSSYAVNSCCCWLPEPLLPLPVTSRSA